MDFLFVVVIVGGFVLIVAPALAIGAFVRSGDLRHDIARLARKVADLEVQVARMGSAGGEARKESPNAAPAIPERVTPAPAEIRMDAPPAPPPPLPKPAVAPPVPEAPARRKTWEEELATRWMVWLGGICAALAAVFLVRYSIEMGWMGPAVRCILGVVIGLALVAGGEWLRRSPFERAAALIEPSRIPPAMVGGGVSALFVSVYAAYGLYGLLPPLLAFVLLGAVWVAAMGLSLLHGPFVAALGILGGFMVPILVQTGHPSAWGLFPYLLAVNAAALGVLRYRGWTWLAWGTLAGAAVWPVLWISETPGELGTLAVGLYLAITAVLFLYVPPGWKPHRTPLIPPDLFANMPLPAILAWVACGAMLVLWAMLAHADGYSTGVLLTGALLAGVVAGAGRRDETYDALAIAAAVAGVLALIVRPLPAWPGEIDVRAVLPDGLRAYAGMASAYAVLFGIGGLALLRGAARPGLWAGISAAAPVAALAVAYARIKGFEVDLKWTAMGLILAALQLAAASWVAQLRADKGYEGALAAYAVGVVAAISLAMTMALENAWLTVMLSLQLPALAWIHERTRVSALRSIALIVAGAILTRLVFNGQLFDYRLDGPPGLNWMFYGYGVPTLAFWAAARMFRRHADDRLVLALDSGALVFLTLFATTEIADIVHGGKFVPGDGLLETSLRSIAWASIAGALLYQCRAERPRIAAVWGWRILASLTAAQVILLHLLALNPLWRGEAVGAWPLVNVLLLAYGAPTAMALLVHRETQRQGLPLVSRIAGIGALVLAFVWLTLEVRHAFHGTRLDLWWTPDAEWYAYSGAWLTYALTLLAAAIRWPNIALRHAALAVLMLTVFKVFLFDAAGLGGLYRVASFLGLALSLFGIGWLYRRFVFAPKPLEPA